MLLLFNFEKSYFDKENIKSTFVGHPLIENKKNSITSFNSLIYKDKKIISLYPGSRNSETSILLPILLDFIKLMNKKNLNYSFFFHATNENRQFIIDTVGKTNLSNVDIISDENLKTHVLSNSIFAVTKSGYCFSTSF